MTWYYVTNNPCTLTVNTAWNNVYLEGRRKGLYTEIFLMFFIYFISQILHTFNRNSVQHSLIPARISEMNEEEQANNKQGGTEERPDLPWHQKRWNRNFAFMFSSHAVALGMAILFSPLTGALVVAYIHLVVFMLYCFCEVRTLVMATKLLRITMDTLNVVLMIIGTVGINYAQYCKNQYGYDVCCRTLY